MYIWKWLFSVCMYVCIYTYNGDKILIPIHISTICMYSINIINVCVYTRTYTLMVCPYVHVYIKKKLVLMISLLDP